MTLPLATAAKGTPRSRVRVQAARPTGRSPFHPEMHGEDFFPVLECGNVRKSLLPRRVYATRRCLAWSGSARRRVSYMRDRSLKIAVSSYLSVQLQL